MSASSFPGNLRATPRTTLFRSSFYQCAPCHLSPKHLLPRCIAVCEFYEERFQISWSQPNPRLWTNSELMFSRGCLCSIPTVMRRPPPILLFQILQSKTIGQPFFSNLGRKVYRFVAIVVIRGGGEGEKIGFIAKPTTNQPNPKSEDASENLKLLLFFSSHVAVCLYTMSQLVGCTARWTA